ncbi:MAG: hypothetical protein ACFFG0_40290 [Candidatus Thorarchaeota archaeon]
MCKPHSTVPIISGNYGANDSIQKPTYYKKQLLFNTFHLSISSNYKSKHLYTISVYNISMNSRISLGEKRKICCHRCGYEWMSKSQMKKPTCPSCHCNVIIK